MMYLLDGNRAREKLLCDDQRISAEVRPRQDKVSNIVR